MELLAYLTCIKAAIISDTGAFSVVGFVPFPPLGSVEYLRTGFAFCGAYPINLIIGHEQML